MKLVIGHSNGQFWNTKNVNDQNYVYIWVSAKIYFILRFSCLNLNFKNRLNRSSTTDDQLL